ncbi:hypothetical protein AXF42_Ash017734 [Apostasia shenzhenica]|uniref:Uncharacterized protein n=1 Tax=Apostasia shenzhenica TaxID=1088818 RepID=A0A2I0B646_9ASPA|nr:hypothetical protein AXF42_Ash017734 [Apostasia shenzhenica]
MGGRIPCSGPSTGQERAETMPRFPLGGRKQTPFGNFLRQTIAAISQFLAASNGASVKGEGLKVSLMRSLTNNFLVDSTYYFDLLCRYFKFYISSEYGEMFGTLAIKDLPSLSPVTCLRTWVHRLDTSR